MASPARQALGIDRLMGMMGFADVVIARNDEHRRGQLLQERRAMAAILLDIRAVDRDIAGMDDEVGSLDVDPRLQGRPVGREMGFRRTEMRVRYLDDAFHPPALACPSACMAIPHPLPA